MSVVVDSVDGGGGVCLVSSCRWCAMFFFLKAKAVCVDLLASDKYFWIIFLGILDHPPFFVIERPRRSCGKNEKGLVCVFAEDFEDVRKCQKVNEIGDRTVLLVTSA